MDFSSHKSVAGNADGMAEQEMRGALSHACITAPPCKAVRLSPAGAAAPACKPVCALQAWQE
jgi:hypothetical protein